MSGRMSNESRAAWKSVEILSTASGARTWKKISVVDMAVDLLRTHAGVFGIDGAHPREAPVEAIYAAFLRVMEREYDAKVAGMAESMLTHTATPSEGGTPRVKLDRALIDAWWVVLRYLETQAQARAVRIQTQSPSSRVKTPLHHVSTADERKKVRASPREEHKATPDKDKKATKGSGVQTIDRFEIVKVLGSGAFGVVYEAIDPIQPNPAKHVAIKVIAIQTSEEDVYGLNPEHVAEISAQKHLSRHPNIVPILDVVRAEQRIPNAAGRAEGAHRRLAEANHVLIIVMPLARSNMRDEMRLRPINFDDRKWPRAAVEQLDERLRWASNIACGLNHMHRQRFLHRDLKPENVLITDEGVAQIADFGLSRSSLATVPSTYGRDPSLIYTLYWRAPELLAWDYNYTYAIDWWAFGLMFFELVTDYLPFYYMSDQSDQGLREFVRSNVGWSAGLKAVLRKSYLQVTDAKNLDTPEQRKDKVRQDEVIAWATVPQMPRNKVFQNLCGTLERYETVEAYYRAYTGRGADSREEVDGDVLWTNIVYALAGLLQVDPELRSDRNFAKLAAPFPCRVLESKEVEVSRHNTFGEFSDFSTPETLALATAIWDHLNRNSESHLIKPNAMYIEERNIWRLATLSLAAKDLEEIYPQLLSGRFSPKVIRQINLVEPTILQRVDGDLWQGMLKEKKPPTPSPLRNSRS